MKRWLPLLFLVITPLALLGQGQTPNIGLYTPAYGAPNWNIQLNQNFAALDLFLSGNSTLPGLRVANTTTLTHLVVTDCVGCGGGGSNIFQTNGAPLASSTTINFLNSAATNGLTLTFTNASAGNIQLGLTGT